ncbi:MAG: Coenzyme F420 hydrogenase/dehydrogenase, beta subunit C-terminal domain [Chromatiales bacterium]|nr:Coenzyme F420 hydrogenase/dehydrogenase, beta subunit C-terminal domain [Chromatiales bacterium]
MPIRPYDASGTVESIVHADLCTNCGFCVPVCPTAAIAMERDAASAELLPVVTPDACVMCPLCLAVCPGADVDFDHYYREYLGTDWQQRYLGYVRTAWIGHSSDVDHRRASASGGMLTELAAFALRSGQLDYVISIRASDGDPLSQEMVLYDDPEALRRSRGSVYHPVALGDGLQVLLARDVPADARLGLIGLPCHIHAAHRLFDSRGRFRKYRWSMIFGLFCGGTWTFRAAEEFLAHQGNTPTEVREFRFRGEGWPGTIQWTTHDGVEHVWQRHGRSLGQKLAQSTFFPAYAYHTPVRCLSCSDGLAELADIAFGDPWLKSERGDRDGASLAVVRTERGARLFAAALDAGLIRARRADDDEVVVSQKGMLTFKQNYEAFNDALRDRGRGSPDYRYRWAGDRPPPRSLRWYARLAYWVHSRGRRQTWLRVPMVVVQGLLARHIKRRVVRLTPRDDDNYFV